jgi:hypothetical protein
MIFVALFMAPGTLRDITLLAAAVLAGAAYDRRHQSAGVATGAASEATSYAGGDAGSEATGNVILVVSDGLRWQEVFRGADSLLLFSEPRFKWGGGGERAEARQRFWRATVAERRQALMPFVWGTMAREGDLVGNRDVGSSVRVTNGLNFSYPGYNEMLVGYPDARIDRNSYGPNPNVTVFEWLNRRAEFRGRVAAIGAWNAFADIFNRKRSGIHMHTSRQEPLDVRSHAAALALLKEHSPRALFVAYVETDDHAHDGRYDRVLRAAHAVDGYLAQLWSAVQSDPRYRGQTTLIFTADHGRGATTRDWTKHGRGVRGADETWIAMIGPPVAAIGERRNVAAAVTAQVAATVAAAVGLDYRSETPRAAEPVFRVSAPVTPR